MTYKQLEKEIRTYLEAHDVYPEFSHLLMLEMLRERDIDMFAAYDHEADANFVEAYRNNAERLGADEPLAYVLGYEWFYGYKIFVDASVLIPRPETEELVGYVLEAMDERYPNGSVADVASGSGAIAIALAKELDRNVYASDISEVALMTAHKNAEYNQADVTFLQGDMLQPLIEAGIHVDVLVCNPPYIKRSETVQTSVLKHEPHVALFGGEDGLFFYRQVLEQAAQVLHPQGMIAFEIGFDLGAAVVACARENFPEAEIVLKQDLNGLDRMIFIFI